MLLSKFSFCEMKTFLVSRGECSVSRSSSRKEKSRLRIAATARHNSRVLAGTPHVHLILASKEVV